MMVRGEFEGIRFVAVPEEVGGRCDGCIYKPSSRCKEGTGGICDAGLTVGQHTHIGCVFVEDTPENRKRSVIWLTKLRLGI